METEPLLFSFCKQNNPKGMEKMLFIPKVNLIDLNLGCRAEHRGKNFADHPPHLAP
jgi:hypothetical protein